MLRLFGWFRKKTPQSSETAATAATTRTHTPIKHPAKKHSKPAGVPSVLSVDLHVLGNLMSDAPLTLDGSVEGHVIGTQVTIGMQGRIQGDIEAELVHVYGKIHGIIRADVVYLHDKCHFDGIIIHDTLHIDDGAHVDGKFKRKSASGAKDTTKRGQKETDEEEDKTAAINLLENMTLVDASTDTAATPGTTASKRKAEAAPSQGTKRPAKTTKSAAKTAAASRPATKLAAQDAAKPSASTGSRTKRPPRDAKA